MSTVYLLPSVPRHATGDTKIMDPYRGGEFKTKGLHWKRMKGLEAVRRFEGTKFYPRLCNQQRDSIEARWSLVHRHRALTIDHQQLDHQQLVLFSEWEITTAFTYPEHHFQPSGFL
jgi:hypothetical protein